VASEAASQTWTWVESVSVGVLLASLAALIGISGGAYYLIESHRLENLCAPDRVSQSATTSHSWTHGFTCTWSDGRRETKFFW
jgi:hypothetical protein